MLDDKNQNFERSNSIIKEAQSSHLPTEKEITSDQLAKNKDFSVHNDVAISGFEDGVARRPYFHFIANILWIFKYEYQKVNRRTELFEDGRNAKTSKHFIDKEYDELVNIIIDSMLKEFYKKSYNEKEALNVKQLKSGQGETKSTV